ncbi:MAG: metallophosphoesterase family protein [Planctomycetia bacterium]|nr:metallophosphoesterase family protein [Planctomycetia bacterium]
MNSCQGFSRRSFFASAAAISGAAMLSSATKAEDEKVSEKPDSFMASHPMLQNVGETSASISWAINRPCTGWVEWGVTPELGKVARNSQFGLNPYETDFLSARITGLAPRTTYYYRTATCSFDYKTAYDKTISEPEYSDIYSFKTVGASDEETSFFVMNDTHNTMQTIQALIKRAEDLNPDMIFWNGDLCSFYMEPEHIKTNICNPTGTPYVAQRPLVYVPGNHDRRGQWARNVPKCLTTWQQEDVQFESLGFNSAFRRGPLACITLDTGEDKPDWHPAWSGMANYEPYRELQAAWLEKVLQRPEIQSAPYLIAFCHIPLYFDNPKANPGNILDKWATIQWPAARMWGPLFEKYGVQLLIAAHLHRFSYHPATAERSWAEIIGGGPEFKNAYSIQGVANSKEFKLTCEKIEDLSIAGSWTFKPRV